MIIERLQIEDIDKVIALYTQLVDFENDIDTSEEIYQKMLENENYHLLVAKENDEILGTALGVVCHSFSFKSKPFMVVEDVIVDKNHRRKGIAKMIFDEIDKIAIENNCYFSILVSGDERKEAHLFYEKQGYIDKAKGFRKKYL